VEPGHHLQGMFDFMGIQLICIGTVLFAPGIACGCHHAECEGNDRTHGASSAEDTATRMRRHGFSG